ncbi:MAG TPA: S-adenosylmethionine:tRNA ribosyltransferase-isomerase, partial [Azospirillaceae bacterium]|nr:S-adenosylmethionine:tRNA ribosyltransferase-isomerase [Azospirillaceae bacterium]
MKTSDFDFHLPPGSIAAHPARPRDSARMLVVPDDTLENRTLEDRAMRDLPEYLRAGDVLVFNDTRVIPARLKGRRGEVKVEITLHKRASDNRWLAFAKPAKRLRPGDRVAFAEDFGAEVITKDGGEVDLRFDIGGPELFAALARHGEMPLPPYIPRPQGAEASDAEDYQTVFAAREGAVAAPTAGLHFTPALLGALAAKGVETVAVTLHVGAGTFLPVKVEDIAEHRMHAEIGEISAEAANAINA